ncbi:unnamed protein product [Prorocentrum cordatum]|uniref:GIY-YIG domain-containing protein n=1 Tax=Prorocentrum cordatum TaxID=2364126 RepID=A0ABN9WZY5_9DINO|nr:unnamed protein product [Polarella glacialis]
MSAGISRMGYPGQCHTSTALDFHRVPGIKELRPRSPGAAGGPPEWPRGRFVPDAGRCTGLPMVFDLSCTLLPLLVWAAGTGCVFGYPCPSVSMSLTQLAAAAMPSHTAGCHQVPGGYRGLPFAFDPAGSVCFDVCPCPCDGTTKRANTFLTDVDAITGELDVSQLPQEMGVYACFDLNSKLQYVGLSRDIRKSVAGHAEAIGIQEAGDLIASVRVADMPGGSKELLKATWEAWIKEHVDSGGEIPPGNVPENMDGADPRWRSRGAQAKPALNLGARPGGISSMAEAGRDPVAGKRSRRTRL